MNIIKNFSQKYRNKLIEYIKYLIVIEISLIIIFIINYSVSVRNVTLTEISRVNVSDLSKQDYSGSNTITVWEYDRLSYYIKVDCDSQNVIVYTTDENGEYTIPVKSMICSTGISTPESGVFEISDKFEWAYLVGNVYGQYATRIVGPILFHSVPYTEKDKSSLEYWEYDKLGTPASKGCVRLTVKDAKWIYDYCKPGTKVEFYKSNSTKDNIENENKVKKEISMKISDYNEELRGWDPTDPDSNNPWIEYLKQNKGEND